MNNPCLNDPERKLQEMMELALDSGVGVILESHDFPALLAHLKRALHPLATAIAADAGVSDPDDLEAVTNGMAVHTAYDLWNATPIPENGFRPHKLAHPERNSPCPCGSQRKYGQCCGGIEHSGLMLSPEEMLVRVLDHLSQAGISAVVALGAPPQVLGLLADRWLENERFEDIVALLAPLFADLRKLDERAEYAANALMTSYLELQQYEARNDLIMRLKKSPDRVLRSTALQREATICSDNDDTRGAWRAFNEAQGLTPDDPSLSHLEVLLLLAEGREAEACARVEFWSARLARDPEHDNHDLIDALHALVETSFHDPLDDLPQDFPQRRLLLHIALEGIEPPIWRRLEVENTLCFAELHHLIQTAMGWENAHLHEFEVGEYRIGISDDDNPFDDEVLPGEDVELGQVIGRRKRFAYLYDFGDGWRHRITIEKRLPSDPQRKPATLIDGERACPPEDCGGVSGYQRILHAKQTPRSTETRELLDWLGPYQPEAFKLAKHQKQIDAMFKRIR